MEQEEKRYSILDELSKCSGYDIVLMTTFNFEIGFFERAVLNRLYAKDVKTISLFVDSREFAEALKEFDALHCGSHLGKRYMVNPIKMDSSFHPKVILLLGEKKARLFIASANIKTSGYATNNEVFNFIDYDVNHPQFLDVIVAAIDFFNEINEMSYKLDNKVIRSAKEYIYYHKAEKNGEVTLLHNIKRSMLEQISEIITEDVKSIRIAVPYYDNELLALQEIKHQFPQAEVELFIQNKFSTFPIEYNKKNNIVQKIKTFSGFEDNKKSSSSSNFYHGKVFLFKTKNKDYVLYGSANCTMSAMTKSFAKGGNIECDFFEIGERSAFDYFFDNITIATEEEFTSQKMTYEPRKSCNFFFKYGELTDMAKLHLNYTKKIEELKIRLGDKELEYEYTNNELIVYIIDDFGEQLTDIFDITIYFDDKEESIRCWTYNPVALANFRETHRKQYDFDDFDVDPSSDKYVEERIRLLNAEITCMPDLQDFRNNQKYFNQIKMEQEGETDEPEDFVIDFQIPDEYRMAYRQYNALSKIRSIHVRRFIGLSILESFSDNIEVSQKSTVRESEPVMVSHSSRKATSEEKSFERFVKSKVKGMFSEVFTEAVEINHFISLYEVVQDIFDKYSEKDPVEDIFLPDYVFSTKLTFLSKMVGKSIDDADNSQEIKTGIIKNSFSVILQNYLYYKDLPEPEDRMNFESLNRKLLMAMEKKYSLRNDYSTYIKQVIFEGKRGVLTLGFKGACDYIEHLYGFKTYEMLCDVIKKVYENAEIITKGFSLRIVVRTENISDYERPDTSVLREIANYSSNVSKVKTVYLIIKNTDPNPERKNIIVESRHEISMDYHQWKLEQTRANGISMNTRSQYLSF